MANETFPNVMADLRGQAEEARTAMLSLLADASRDYQALGGQLDRYAEYQHAADTLEKAADG